MRVIFFLQLIYYIQSNPISKWENYKKGCIRGLSKSGGTGTWGTVE